MTKAKAKNKSKVHATAKHKAAAKKAVKSVAKAKLASKKVVKAKKNVKAKPAKPVKKARAAAKHVEVIARSKAVVKTKPKMVAKAKTSSAQKGQKTEVKKGTKVKNKQQGKHLSNGMVKTNKPEPKQLWGQDAGKVVKPSDKVTSKKAKGASEPELGHRYSDEDLKEFKVLIETKLQSAREELKNLKESLDNHTESQVGNKAWNLEEGTDTSEMEYLMNQISRQHQYIRNLELAMVRVENKTYGICRQTGKLIPKERLRIVPHATLSLEAKMTRKTEEVSPGAAINAPPTDFSEGFED